MVRSFLVVGMYTIYISSIEITPDLLINMMVAARLTVSFQL